MRLWLDSPLDGKRHERLLIPFMQLEHLKQFLLYCSTIGYATANESAWKKETDGSTTIFLEHGKWTSHDNFFGGEPYAGRVVVSYATKPYWIMVYYGTVAQRADPDSVYKILRNALKQMPSDAPFRGPKEYIEGSLVYTNTWEGTIERYSGEEVIKQQNETIYKAHYMGGLVDQRKGL